MRQCDRICVIDQGTVVESGTHEELMENASGTYRRLADRQFASTAALGPKARLHIISLVPPWRESLRAQPWVTPPKTRQAPTGRTIRQDFGKPWAFCRARLCSHLKAELESPPGAGTLRRPNEHALRIEPPGGG